MALSVMARIALGGWFFYSGAIKWQNSGIDRFIQDVANYRMVPPPWDEAVAYGVLSLECVAGLCLCCGILRRAALVAVESLVAVFIVAVGWAWFHQLDISCGCRGGGAPIHYWAKVAEFALYGVVLGMLWMAENAEKSASRMKKSET